MQEGHKSHAALEPRVVHLSIPPYQYHEREACLNVCCDIELREEMSECLPLPKTTMNNQAQDLWHSWVRSTYCFTRLEPIVKRLFMWLFRTLVKVAGVKTALRCLIGGNRKRCSKGDVYSKQPPSTQRCTRYLFVRGGSDGPNNTRKYPILGARNFPNDARSILLYVVQVLHCTIPVRCTPFVACTLLTNTKKVYLVRGGQRVGERPHKQEVHHIYNSHRLRNKLRRTLTVKWIRYPFRGLYFFDEHETKVPCFRQPQGCLR